MAITLDGTTGIVAPAIDVATPITVSDGGTGASTLTSNNVLLGAGTSAVTFVAPGSSGNVLTSDGTTWASAAGGVTSFNTRSGAVTLSASDVGTASAGLLTGDLGTYAFLTNKTQSAGISSGSTYAGSGLQYSGLRQGSITGSGNLSASFGGGSPGGTWQAMGHVNAVATWYPTTLFLRVA
jgi:hypothetical protein